MLERILPVWLQMEQTLEALLSGDKSMLLWGVLEGHGTRTYEQAVEVMDAILDMEPTEPMAHVEDVHEHYAYPDGYDHFSA